MLTPRTDRELKAVLVVNIRSLVCALPLDSVQETMRPLPVKPMADAPEGLLGLALIRGKPVPVVDASVFVGSGKRVKPGRFVTIEVGNRLVALAVEDVIGIRKIPQDTLENLPPLLAGEEGAQAVSALAVLDAELLLLLRPARLLERLVEEADALPAEVA